MNRYLDKEGLTTVFNIINDKINSLLSVIDEMKTKVDELETIVKKSEE